MATVIGTSGNDPALNGTNDADTIIALGGADTINGLGGADVIIAGAGGSDTIDGGSGIDTLVLGGSFAGYDISFNGGQLLVTTGLVTETVTGVEVVAFDDQVVRVVGAGSEHVTIQSAVTAAASGEIIFVAPGDYSGEGRISVSNKTVEIRGALFGESPVSNAAAWADEADRTIVEAFQVTGSAGLTLDGVQLLGQTQPTGGDPFSAVQMTGTGGLTVRNSTVSAEQDGFFSTGLEIGYVDGDVTIDNVSFFGFTGSPGDPVGTFSAYGIFLNSSAAVDRNVSITNSSFDLREGGSPDVRAYAIGLDGEQGGSDDFVITGNTFNDLTFAIRAFDFANSLSAADDYSGVSGNTFTDTGEASGNIQNNTAFVIETGANISNGVSYSAMHSGTASADTISGDAGIELLAGNGGNDVITGGGGADKIYGGDGVDTADYTGENYADATVAWNGSAFTVSTAAQDTDTLIGVEKADFDDNDVWLVTTAAELTAALAGAASGDVIKLAPGIYEGSFSIATAGLTIESATGVAGDVALLGTFFSANGLDPMIDSVADFLQGASSYGGGLNATGLTVSANDVTIKNISLSGYVQAIDLGSNSGLTIEGVVFDGNVNGIRKGTAAAVSDFTWLGGSVSDGQYGTTINAAIDDSGDFTGVLIDGVGFSNLNEKGLYFEQLSDADLLNIVMTDVGQYGRTTPFGGNGTFGNGIDINLKYEAYSAILISDFTFTDVGLSNGAGTPHAFGAAIVVKARDDAASGYGAPNDATLDGVIIQNGTIDGTSTGVRIGEPNRTNAGPSNVVVTDVSITNDVAGDYDNRSQSVLTVNLPDGGVSVTTNAGATGSLSYFGGDGGDGIVGGAASDQINGGGGGDGIDGGAGVDTATYTQAIDAYSVTDFGFGQFQVATGGGEGTDLLSNVEIIDGAEAGKILLVGNGGYATITAAVAAAADGDTIVVAAGVYDEDLTINKVVTILGAQAGVAGTGGGRSPAAGMGETTIIGVSQINAAGAVTIDGVRFLHDATTGTGAANPSLRIASGHDHTVKNAIFYSTVAGGGTDDYAVAMNALGESTVTFADNYFTGAFTGGFATASFARGIYLSGGGVDLVATGNTFEFLRTGLNLDLDGTSVATVSGNVFRTNGTAISLGFDTDGLSVSNNTFQNVGTDFNFRNLTTDVTFDAGAAIGTLTPASPANLANDAVVILGGSGGDTLLGTQGVDFIDGNNHPMLGLTADDDSLAGLGGADILFGRAGNDRLDGGSGADQMTGGTGNDTYVVDDAGDVIAENSGEGTDTVETTLSTFTLAANFENLTFVGSGNFTGIGNSAQNTMTGGAGNDTLNGGGGIDSYYGGLGDDLYIISGGGDNVFENANEGADRVQSAVISLDLANYANVENATLAGSANLNLTGSAVANRLTGNAGENIIIGGGGQDILVGGAGADVFRYIALSDTAAGADDILNDFVKGEDIIDLLGVDARTTSAGNNAFVWIDTAAFSNVAGQLRYQFQGANTVIQGDVDGNGTADLVIRIRNQNVALDDGDFIL